MVRQFPDLNDCYPAGLWRRLAAIVYDSLLVLALWFLVGFIGVGIVGGEANEHWLFWLAVWSVPVVFYAFFWRRSGQTLGMMAWRLRVQTKDGYPLNLRQTLLRLLGGLLSWIPPFLGLLWVVFDLEKRSWSDLLSGTQVVVVPPPQRKG